MIRCSRFEKIGIRIKIKYENISWVAKTKQTKRIPNIGVSTVIILSRRYFLLVVQVELWTLA